jgi:hypothetical protein
VGGGEASSGVIVSKEDVGNGCSHLLATIPGIKDGVGLFGFVINSECTAGTKDVDKRYPECPKLAKKLSLGYRDVNRGTVSPRGNPGR